MDWESVTLVSVGFGLYCLTLILRSTSLRHLRFLRVVDLAQIHEMPQHQRAWIFAGSLPLSLIMMGVALWQSINTDRSTFHLLGTLGIMLVVIRLLGFFFTKVSLVALEIETDKSELNFTHLRRSPLIMGGVVLIIVGFIIPAAFDKFVLQKRFEAYINRQWEALDNDARKQGFKSSLVQARGAAACTTQLADAGRQEFTYRPRTFIMHDASLSEHRAPLSEPEFFRELLRPRSRIVIEGRAGIGKTWFLMQLRFFLRNCRPERPVIFLRATNLTPPVDRDIDLLDHISRSAFNELAWAARPVTRQSLAEAFILIDGLDELGPIATVKNHIAAIIKFDADKSLPNATVVMTTRPRPIGPLLTKEGFVKAEIHPLTATQSMDELNRDDRMAKLSEKLRRQWPPADASLLSLFAAGPVPVSSTITTGQTATLYRGFVRTFFSTYASGDKPRMPFLSTYRDIGIVEDLFLEVIAGKFKLPPAPKSEEVRTELIGRYLQLRMAKNYHAKLSDDFARLVIDEITKISLNYLHNGTQQTFSFDRSQFQQSFSGSTLEQIVLESELLTEQGERLVFDNPDLDEYFRARVRVQFPGTAGLEKARLLPPVARVDPDRRNPCPSGRRSRSLGAAVPARGERTLHRSGDEQTYPSGGATAPVCATISP